MAIYPITFSIPSNKIVYTMPTKINNIFAIGYRYNTDEFLDTFLK